MSILDSLSLGLNPQKLFGLFPSDFSTVFRRREEPYQSWNDPDKGWHLRRWQMWKRSSVAVEEGGPEQI